MSHKIHFVKGYDVELAQWLKSCNICIQFGNELGIVAFVSDGDDHILS